MQTSEHLSGRQRCDALITALSVLSRVTLPEELNRCMGIPRLYNASIHAYEQLTPIYYNHQASSIYVNEEYGCFTVVDVNI
uniref:Transposase n=1 Tax=Ascaris lumbricoides TaxID=6252 RepID=A0A0M3HUY0_ASCLU